MPGLPRTPREVLSSLQALATLRALGWHRAVSGSAVAGGDNEPLPWLTYPAVSCLDRLLAADVRVFEYGSGSSTRWLAAPGRVKEIVSVEHDTTWFARLAQPANGRILHVPSASDWWDGDEHEPYVRAIRDGAPWDVVLIDGVARNTCAQVCGDHLTATGLVVLDDTDRPRSLAGQEALTRRGFGRLDLWGFKPGIGTATCTTLFSRDFNSWLVRPARPRDLAAT